VAICFKQKYSWQEISETEISFRSEIDQNGDGVLTCEEVETFLEGKIQILKEE
jgi:hypothetical protein